MNSGGPGVREHLQKNHSPESARVAVARSCASRRNSSCLLPTRWQQWGTHAGCCPTPAEGLMPGFQQLPSVWLPRQHLGWWILKKKNTLLAAAPLFLKVKKLLASIFRNQNFTLHMTIFPFPLPAFLFFNFWVVFSFVLFFIYFLLYLA